MSDKYVVETYHYRSCLNGIFWELVNAIELSKFYDNFSTFPSKSYNMLQILKSDYSYLK